MKEKTASLTKKAKVVSDLIEGLSPKDQRLCVDCIVGMKIGIENLAKMPPEAGTALWDTFLEFFRKIIVASALGRGSEKGELYVKQMVDGLSPNVQKMAGIIK